MNFFLMKVESLFAFAPGKNCRIHPGNFGCKCSWCCISRDRNGGFALKTSASEMDGLCPTRRVDTERQWQRMRRVEGVGGRPATCLVCVHLKHV